MKPSLVLLGLSATLSTANIVFPRVQPLCDILKLDFAGCLRGQICHENNKCTAALRGSSSSSSSSRGGFTSTSNKSSVAKVSSTSAVSTAVKVSSAVAESSSAAVSKVVKVSSSVAVSSASTAISTSSVQYSQDGKCGPANGGILCDPNSTVYKGSCCSQYGWCGSTSDHCGTGCLSGCNPLSSSVLVSISASTQVEASRADSSAAQSSAGNSAQQSGTSTQEPVIAPATSTTGGSPSATGSVTTDGTCGAKNRNTICGNWAQGSCRSMYGFCGNSTAHCGDGCQNGPCLNGAAVEAPAASAAPAASVLGTFEVVGKSGVPAMHAGLLPNGKVVFLDKVENYTQLLLSDSQYAYSSEYDVETNNATALSYKTNAFCSGGGFLADGTFISVGGNGPLTDIDPTITDGFDALRYIKRSASDASLDGQNWIENNNKLNSKRWYASVQTMGDGTIFVASGSLNGLDPTVNANNNPTYEILTAEGVSQGESIPMEILIKNQPYYMYPFMHLLRDGSLFVFVSKASEIFDVAKNSTVKTFSDLPGDYRTYPNTGGSVLLPLSSASNWDPDVIVCGGGAYQDISAPTDPSCGRIQPLSTNGTWEMDSMPEGRVMVEGTLLADGTVVWVNGGNYGAQGFGLCKDPTLEALLYDPTLPLGKRWTTGGKSEIPRLYHSVALLLLDGTLMITGSNPVEQPVLTASDAHPYVTDFRVEIYTPPYLQGDNAKKRPTDVNISSKSLKADSSTFTISFTIPEGAKAAKISLYHGGFVTHSLHMGHRMAFLDSTGWVDGSTSQILTVTMPPNSNVAPPGPYVIYVVVDGVPAIGQFVMVA